MNQQKIKDNYGAFSKPLIGELVGLLKLDKIYHRAYGDNLYYFKNKEEVKVLDLAGGYGALLLGHNNKELKEYIKHLYDKETPAHAQLSIRSGSAMLSERINQIISAESNQNYISTFLNTGSEAVEAAIKHALLEFNKKMNCFCEEQETAFLNIKNYCNRYSSTFQFCFNDQTFTDYKTFILAVKTSNEAKLKRFTPSILASKGSYHGKTLGALSITYNNKFKNPFFKESPIQTTFFEWDEHEIQNHILSNDFYLDIPKINSKGKLIIKRKPISTIMAVIVEPILGESGIRVFPKKLLEQLRSETLRKDIPLIFDEVQCGFYRTGAFLASFKSKVYADYYVMGKSLGGGLAKISALIINKRKYIPEFEVIHSSTFSDDDISSFAALKSIDIASQNQQEIVEKGEYIRKELVKVKEKYVDVITDVRGDGLMIGISFKSFKQSECYGFQSLSRSDYFGYLLVAYLLNKENIRVSVTLSNTRTIRIHPSCFISKSSIDSFVKAIDKLSYILDCNDLYALISPLLEEKYQDLRPAKHYDVKNIRLDTIEDSKTNVGFLVHYINLDSIRQCIPSFEGLSNEAITDIAHTAMKLGEPVVLGRNKIRNIYGEKVTITFIGLPFTSKNVRDDLIESRHSLKRYQDFCSKAIAMLYNMGISTIGLGQFTSIIMQNGRAVHNSNLTITSGNSFTVYSALKQVFSHLDKTQNNNKSIAIIGAGGNIATVISQLLIKHCNEILLVGSSKNSEQKIILHAEILIKSVLNDLLNNTYLETKLYRAFLNSKLLIKVKEDRTFLDSGRLWDSYITEFSTNPPIKISWHLDDLKHYDVTVVATNQGEPFLKPKHFKNESLVCDISVPTNCTEELLNNTDVHIIKGGIVYLPNGEHLYPKGLPLIKGQAFACMCETLLLGFEESKISYSFGSLSAQQVKDVGVFGEKHGFKHFISSNKTTIKI